MTFLFSLDSPPRKFLACTIYLGEINNQEVEFFLYGFIYLYMFWGCIEGIRFLLATKLCMVEFFLCEFYLYVWGCIEGIRFLLPTKLCMVEFFSM